MTSATALVRETGARQGQRPAGVLRGIDRAAFATALAVRLRNVGVPVGLTAVEDFIRALTAAPPEGRTALYWTARISLVRSHAQLALFDAVFDAVFADAYFDIRRFPGDRPTLPPGRAEDALVGLPERAADEQDGAGLPWATLPRVVDAAEDSDSPLGIPQRLPSGLEALVDTAFEQLDPDDLAVLGAWLAASVRRWPTRRSRRAKADPAGHRIALRPTIARSRRTGWEPVELVRVRQVQVARPVVMLCDVSQSMQAQARAYLHLMRALTVAAHAEVFAFATDITRLTAVLQHRSAAAAIELASAEVTDRFGGTRIATNIAALLRSRHGNLLRGAVVIVASDGWDSDPPEDLAAAMARLQRRAHRVLWINPRAAAPGFEPRVASMAAAVPYCDRLLPADTFGSLRAVIDEIASEAG